MRALSSRSIITGMLALGCSKAVPAPLPANPSPPGPTPTAASQASGSSAPVPPPELPPRPPPDGCTTDVTDPGAPEPLLAAVAKSCVADMKPLAPEPLLVSLAPGTLKDMPFTITDPTKCIRAAAAGAKDVKELELTIVDRSDRILGADQLSGQVALANPDGPVCLKDPGQYRAVVRMVEGSGSVAIQVWQSE